MIPSDSGGLHPTESQPSRWSSVSFIDGEDPGMGDLNTPLAKSVSSLFRRNSEHVKEKFVHFFTNLFTFWVSISQNLLWLINS